MQRCARRRRWWSDAQAVGIVTATAFAVVAAASAEPTATSSATGSRRARAQAEAASASESSIRLTSAQLDSLRDDLHGPALDTALEAARVLGRSQDPRARALLIGALRMGAPPAVLTALLEATAQQRAIRPPQAMGHQAQAAPDILAHYCRYRDPTVRIAALRAIGTLPGDEATEVLLDALGDSNAKVRAAAATLLGDRGERRAEAPLLVLLRKRDLFAAEALGAVASAETAMQLADLVTVLPAETVALAFGAMLKRKDFGPDPLRVRIVRALGNLGQDLAAAPLLEYISSIPAREVRLSKTIAEKLVAGRAP